MKRSIFMLLAVFIASVTMSCVKDGLTYTERRIIGMWEFERVRETHQFSLRTNDISSEYAGSTIEFTSDKRAVMVHNGMTYEGIWETTTGGETTQLFISLAEVNTDEVKHIIFNSFNIMNQVLRGESSTPQLWKRYKLRKI